MTPLLSATAVTSLVALLAACSPRVQTTDDTGPAPVDTGAPVQVDTSAPMPADTGMPTPTDTTAGPDTSVATPPITPPRSAAPQDTPPGNAPNQRTGKPAGQAGAVSQIEYEGWRQYSVHCARCHGQDVLPNPVAANLLVSLAAGGPIDSKEKFVQVVSAGRPERGMPAFKGVLSQSQIEAMYAYVKGRADKRIPPGRPEQPAG